ncbi:MAG TPA: hypothetical protein PLC64_04055 [Steroidobacteraceae bacterium]|nr:hypothetical protein [Steroidobacteraceae bacterium]
MLPAFNREHPIGEARGLTVEIGQRLRAASEEPARHPVDLYGHHFERSARRGQRRPDRIDASYVDPLK